MCQNWVLYNYVATCSCHAHVKNNFKYMSPQNDRDEKGSFVSCYNYHVGMFSKRQLLDSQCQDMKLKKFQIKLSNDIKAKHIRSHSLSKWASFEKVKSGFGASVTKQRSTYSPSAGTENQNRKQKEKSELCGTALLNRQPRKACQSGARTKKK